MSCRVADWFRPLLRVIEFCADLTLVLLSAVAFLVAAVALEAPTSFETADPAAGYEYGQPQPPQFTYYTLPAYYLTFSSAQAVSALCSRCMNCFFSMCATV